MSSIKLKTGKLAISNLLSKFTLQKFGKDVERQVTNKSRWECVKLYVEWDHLAWLLEQLENDLRIHRIYMKDSAAVTIQYHGRKVG